MGWGVELELQRWCVRRVGAELLQRWARRGWDVAAAAGATGRDGATTAVGATGLGSACDELGRSYYSGERNEAGRLRRRQVRRGGRSYCIMVIKMGLGFTTSIAKIMLTLVIN
jgi:hypothetical protein